jgi:TRAP transporter TAXI family solute receptor
MKKSLAVVLVVAALFVFAGSAFAVTFITIGSGGVGGTYYPLGGAMAEVLTKADIGVKATSRSTSASRENCRLLAAGRAQIGMTMGSTLYQAYKGMDAFKQDGELPLRILMHMYPAPHHLVTTTRTGITSFEGIKGKKVSLGAPGGGDQVLTQMILEVAGIDPEKDIQKQQLTQPEGVMALKDGNVDAVFWNFATPGSAVLEVSAVRDVVLIPLPQDVVDGVAAKHPFLFAYKIPKETYPGQKEDVLTVADGNFLAVHADMEEKLGYDLVKTLIENREEFMKVTQQAAHFVPEEAGVGIIPFTSGAAKYFAEHGIEVEAK